MCISYKILINILNFHLIQQATYVTIEIKPSESIKHIASSLPPLMPNATSDVIVLPTFYLPIKVLTLEYF